MNDCPGPLFAAVITYLPQAVPTGSRRGCLAPGRKRRGGGDIIAPSLIVHRNPGTLYFRLLWGDVELRLGRLRRFGAVVPVEHIFQFLIGIFNPQV